MKLFGARTHEAIVASHVLTATAASMPAEKLDFSRIYEQHFDEVARWAGALGGPAADLDDLAQEVFLVVRRKLHRFDGRNLRAWLYAITARTVSDHRRRAWFRNVLSRRRDIELDSLPRADESPAELVERAEARRLLYRLLEKMSEKRRTAFVLFEIEGYSGEEIAGLLGVPLATVWTRLHHARREFLARVAEMEKP